MIWFFARPVPHTRQSSFAGGEIAILETQGRYKNFWIDINRTAHIGPASQAYKEQYAAVARPSKLSALASSRVRIPQRSATSVASPLQPSWTHQKNCWLWRTRSGFALESPVPYPGTGLHGAKEGFIAEEGMVISIDCLYFGSKLGPSHGERVYRHRGRCRAALSVPAGSFRDSVSKRRAKNPS